MRIRNKYHRIQNPEPGEPGTGATPIAEPSPTPIPTPAQPAATDPPAPAAPAAPQKPEPTDPPADPFGKLESLLDNVGKPDADPKPAAPTAKPPTAEPGPKPADPKAVDLTPPEGMTDRAKGRWAELSERAKLVPDLERRASEAEQQLQGVRALVRDSGLDQTEFGNMLEMGRLFKSADPKELQTALQQLDGLRADLATRLGVDAPGIDPLAAHADLKAEVDAMTISRERALEIVKLRGTQAQVAASTKANQEQTQFVRTVQSAAAEMDAALQERASTPGHQSKVAHITSYFKDPAKLQQFVQIYQPNQWKSAILMMYDSYNPPAPTPTPSPQPLRPSAGGAGPRVATNPKTAEEAVMGAFERLGL